MYNKYLMLLLSTPLVLLSGCQSTGAIKVKTVEVPIEVPVSCINKKDIPAEVPKIGDQLTGDAITDIMVITPNALMLRQANNVLRALTKACIIED